MDVLSEVLKAVKTRRSLVLQCRVFSAVVLFGRQPRALWLPYLSPDSRHVIIFHLLTEGRGYAHVEGDGRPVPLNAGDIVIFPHGDPHIMGNGSPVKPVDMRARVGTNFRPKASKSPAMGGGGEITKFICGYMACDPQLSRVFLGGLPPVLKINIRNDASGQWLENSIRYSVGRCGRIQARWRSGGRQVV